MIAFYSSYKLLRRNRQLKKTALLFLVFSTRRSTGDCNAAQVLSPPLPAHWDSGRTIAWELHSVPCVLHLLHTASTPCLHCLSLSNPARVSRQGYLHIWELGSQGTDFPAFHRLRREKRERERARILALLASPSPPYFAGSYYFTLTFAAYNPLYALRPEPDRDTVPAHTVQSLSVGPRYLRTLKPARGERHTRATVPLFSVVFLRNNSYDDVPR
jgi:hypothetical protein